MDDSATKPTTLPPPIFVEVDLDRIAKGAGKRKQAGAKPPPKHSVRLKRDKCPIRSLPIDSLSLIGDTQPRAEIDQDVVAEYAELMEAGAKFPPIVVFTDGATYWVADGFHRYWAIRRLKREKIDCEVHQGTVEDARWYSYSANQTHGLRRSNEDKRKAVLAALRHPKGAKLSDGKLAEHVGVSQPFVSKVRRESETTQNNFESPTRTGRDGRTIDTANIGRKRDKQTGIGAAVCDAFDVTPDQLALALAIQHSGHQDLIDAVDKGKMELGEAVAEVQRRRPSPTCPNCGSHEVDEDGDCLKCREPGVAPAPAPADAATEAQREKCVVAAHECINILSCIGKSNPYRARAWEIVRDWLHHNE